MAQLMGVNSATPINTQSNINKKRKAIADQPI